MGCSFSPSEPFDGPNFFSVGLHCEYQAGAHRLAVHDHGAGAADAVLAADMGAGLSAILADCIGQRAPWLYGNRVVAAINDERDVGFAVHLGFWSAHPRASGDQAQICCLSAWIPAARE